MGYVFTPPVVYDRPPILGQDALADALFKYYEPRARGVNVFLLQDGTLVQDTPTPENENSNVPYPIGSPGNIVATYWDPLALTQVNVTVANPVVKTYYGGHSIPISAAEAATLIAGGYNNYVTGP